LAMLVSYLVDDTWSLPCLSRSTGMGSQSRTLRWCSTDGRMQCRVRLLKCGQIFSLFDSSLDHPRRVREYEPIPVDLERLGSLAGYYAGLKYSLRK